MSKTAKQRSARRSSAYSRLRSEGVGEKEAARRSMREEPFLKSQRGADWHGVRVFTGKKKKRIVPKQFAKRKVKVRRKVTRTVTRTEKRRRRVAFGRFKRLEIVDPRTGRKKLSYLYRDPKTGRRRKIPDWAIAGAKSAKAYKDSKHDKPRARTSKRRAASARRVTRSGGPFTPNRPKKRSTSMRTNKKRVRRRKTTRRRRRYSSNARRRTVQARRAAPNRRRKKRASPTRRRRKKVRTNARKVRRNTHLTTNRRRTKRRTKRAAPTKRRSTKASRSAAAKLGWRRRRTRGRAKVGKGRGRGGRYLARGKVYYKGRKPKRLRGIQARKLPKARFYITNRRRKRRKTTRRRRPVRRNARRSKRLTSNQFMAKLRETFTTAAFVTLGFVGHKALTHGLCNKLLMPMLEKTGNGAAANNAVTGFGQNGNGNNKMLKQALPILCGGVVAGVGVWASSRFAPKKRADAISAGMLTSWLHTTLMAVLDMVGGKTATEVTPWISGYDTASTAAAIGRYRRRRGTSGMRGMRGLGQIVPDKNISSILPQYAPTGQPGGMQQAVAMAGGGGRGTGEYFSTSGVGEYFATGVQGIGHYEPAGPLVTQAAAGLGQQIDNGIMPDQADAALTLAEAQAGTGGTGGVKGLGRRGMGEFYSAAPSNGDWSEYRVPTKSQWIPSGPLWAGTSPAHDTLQTSEIPAGVLESASGNGIF